MLQLQEVSWNFFKKLRQLIQVNPDILMRLFSANGKPSGAPAKRLVTEASLTLPASTVLKPPLKPTKQPDAMTHSWWHANQDHSSRDWPDRWVPVRPQSHLEDAWRAETLISATRQDYRIRYSLISINCFVDTKVTKMWIWWLFLFSRDLESKMRRMRIEPYRVQAQILDAKRTNTSRQSPCRIFL